MNFSKALDLIAETDNKIKVMEEAKDKLRLALAAKAEFDNGAKAKIMLVCGEGIAPMDIDGLLAGNNFTAEIKKRVDEIAIKYYLKLQNHNIYGGTGHTKIETPEPQKLPEIIPEPEPPKMETQEAAPEEKAPTPTFETPESKAPREEQHGIEIPEQFAEIKRKKINDKVIAELYYKQSKTVKEIVLETGYGESTVFKHLSNMKAAKEKAAKECVRR